MKHSRTLTFMARKWILSLFIILSSPSLSHTQTENNPSASLLCISDCETCPVICSPPPSNSPPPPAPLKPPPPPPSPPVHHYSPPQSYYFTSPSPSSPPAHPPPPPPTPGGASPPRPSVYVYNPGTTPPSGTGQRNLSYPYYYFYASEASSNYLSLYHQGSILLTFFILFRILCGY